MPESNEVLEPKIRTSRIRGRLSAVWLFPVVALALGIGLAVNTLSQLGPRVVVLVDDASGLSADDTTVRYRDMEMGVVEGIDFTDDLSRIRLTLRLHPVFAPYLTQSARFWVAKPRVSLTGISGLETLVSGSYLSFSPGTLGEPRLTEFEALRVPPISVRPGTRYLVEADDLGGLETGDPIYYRGERVGTVLNHHLHANARSVGIAVHINRPYDKLIRTNTVFWNTSGVRFHLGWRGLSVETPTFAAALAGGMSFATPTKPAERAAGGSVFAMEDDYEDKWGKWSPEIKIGESQEGESDEGDVDVIEEGDDKLFHHRGEKAGDPSTPKGQASWFRRLYEDVTRRID